MRRGALLLIFDQLILPRQPFASTIFFEAAQITGYQRLCNFLNQSTVALML